MCGEQVLARLLDQAPRIGALIHLPPQFFRIRERQAVVPVPEAFSEQGRRTLIHEDTENRLAENLVLWGTALFMRATAIRRVGYFDERYFAYHEDLDYSLRTLAAGFRTVVEPRAVVYHKTPSSVRLESPFKAYLFSRNLLLFWSTHLDRLSRWTYRPKYLAWAIRQAAELRDAGNHAAADACLDGAWSALRGRYGPPTKALPMLRALRHVVSSHPYLCIWLLTGQFQRILRALASRL